jgi:hypothetical protein
MLEDILEAKRAGLKNHILFFLCQIYLEKKLSECFFIFFSYIINFFNSFLLNQKGNKYIKFKMLKTKSEINFEMF